jgi:Mg2+/Co2+ transporter CorB
MATSLELLGLLFIVLVNTAVTALATRFFRVRLHTQWGSAIYTALLVPVLLVILTLVIGSLGVGPNLGSAAAVLGLTVVLPMAVGVAFDYFWMPSPEEVDLPEQYGDRDSQPRRSR